MRTLFRRLVTSWQKNSFDRLEWFLSHCAIEREFGKSNSCFFLNLSRIFFYYSRLGCEMNDYIALWILFWERQKGFNLTLIRKGRKFIISTYYYYCIFIQKLAKVAIPSWASITLKWMCLKESHSFEPGKWRVAAQMWYLPWQMRSCLKTGISK